MPESHNEEDLVALTVLGLLDIESRARPSQAEASPRPTRDQIRRRLLPADRKGGLSEEERRDLDNKRNTEQELPNSSINTLGRDGEPYGAEIFASDSEMAEEAQGNISEPAPPPRPLADELPMDTEGNVELTPELLQEFVSAFSKEAGLSDYTAIIRDDVQMAFLTQEDKREILEYMNNRKEPTKYQKILRFVFLKKAKRRREYTQALANDLKTARNQLKEEKEKSERLRSLERKTQDALKKALESVQSATKISSPQKNRQLQSLQKKVQELTAKVQQEEMIAEANITTMQNSINDANEELKSAKSKNAKLQSELSKNKATFDNQIEKLTKKMREISAEKGALERQLAGEQAKQAAIDEQIGKNSNQIAELNSTLESAMGALEAAQKDAENAKAAQVAAEARAAEADEGSQDLREQLEAANKKIEDLEQSMKERADELNAAMGANSSVAAWEGEAGVNDRISESNRRLPTVDEESEVIRQGFNDSPKVVRNKGLMVQGRTPMKGQGQSPNSRRRQIEAARKAAKAYAKAEQPPGPPNGSPGRKNLTPEQIRKIARARAAARQKEAKEMAERVKGRKQPPRRTSSRAGKGVRGNVFVAGGDNIEGNPPKKPANLFKPLRF